MVVIPKGMSGERRIYVGETTEYGEDFPPRLTQSGEGEAVSGLRKELPPTELISNHVIYQFIVLRPCLFSYLPNRDRLSGPFLSSHNFRALPFETRQLVLSSFSGISQ